MIDPVLLSIYCDGYVRSGYEVDVAKACQALLRLPMQDRTVEFLASQNEKAEKWCMRKFGYVPE